MAFRPIPWQQIADSRLREVFEHAHMYLADVYTMLDAVPPPNSNGGRCNFSAALVLCAVFDGIAVEVYPTKGTEPDPESRFKKLALKYLVINWGPASLGWIPLSEVGGTLYLELRNPLAHQLARDIPSGVRRTGYGEPYIVRSVKGGYQPPADELESMTSWNPEWPVLWAETPAGKQTKSLKLSVPALYWHVKDMVLKLATDTTAQSYAIANRI